jgi:ribokinase
MTTKPITVLGAFMADLVARADRMPAWGETLRGNSFAMGPGGKGSNQAVAAARQGAPTHLITRLGRDAFARMARDVYTDEGLDTRFVAEDADRTTGTASITVDDASGENAIITVPGAAEAVSEADVDAAASVITESAVFISQLELPTNVCRYGIGIAHERGVPVLLNPAPALDLPDELLAKVDYLTPNESEAAGLTGQAVASAEEALAAARTLRERGVTHVLVTLGAEGVCISSPDYEGVIPAAHAGATVETTGAGDAFNGAFAAAIAEGQSLASAARLGTTAAGIAVTRPGAALAIPRRQEVDALLQAPH